MKRTVTLLYAASLTLALAVAGFAQVNPRLPAPNSPPAGSPVAVHGQLSVSGNKVRGNNQDVTLRGMSYFWSNSDQAPLYSDGIVGWLAHDWKISVVRAAMAVGIESQNDKTGYADGDSTANVNRVKTVVEAAIRRGIYVIIDWHTHTRATGTDQNKAVTFFSNMAREYGAYPNIIYEIFNEPTIGSGQINTYSNAVINAIRAIDNRNIIIVGTPEYSSQPGYTPAPTPSNTTNLVYAMHFYADSHKGDYRTRVSSALSGNRSVFVSEFGTGHASGSGGSHNPGETDTWISFMETNKVSWVNWAISAKRGNNETTSIFADYSGAVSSQADAAEAMRLASQASSWTTSNSPALHTRGTYMKGKIRGYNAAAYPNFSTTFTINATVDGIGGRVEKRVNNAVNNGPYGFGTKVAIVAVPDAGYEFDGWSGEIGGANATVEYSVVGINIDGKASFWKSNLVQNGTFTHNTTGWNATSCALVRENDEARVNVTTAGTAIGDARFSQNNIRLVKGVEYELSFKARGQAARPVVPRVTNTTRTRDYLSETQISLTTTMQPFSRKFVSDTTLPTAQLSFNFGGSATTWFIDDVRIDSLSFTDVATRARTVKTTWSVARASDGLRLAGPAGVDVKVTLFDMRGRAVKTMAAKDGMTLATGMLPAGNYLLVVKSGAGREVYRDKVVMAR